MSCNKSKEEITFGSFNFHGNNFSGMLNSFCHLATALYRFKMLIMPQKSNFEDIFRAVALKTHDTLPSMSFLCFSRTVILGLFQLNRSFLLA